MTVGDAIRELNEKHCHEAGYHVCMHYMKLLPEELANTDAPHHLMKQTYDWRYGKPDRESYTVTLTGEDMEYIGNALEVYERAMFELHLKPHIEEICRKMGERQEDKSWSEEGERDA